MRAWSGLIGLALLGAPFWLPGSAAAGPVLTDRCSGGVLSHQGVFTTVAEELENLHFHEGHLLLTGGDGLLRAYTPDGKLAHQTDLGQRSGAMATGPDGALYVRVGSSNGEVWRFPAGDPENHTVYATGLKGANGLAIDPDGIVYVSDEPTGNIYRIEGPGQWKVWTVLESPNGLTIDPVGRFLYVAMTGDGRSSILRISLDDPKQTKEVATLSFGAYSVNPFAPTPTPRTQPPSQPGQPAVPKGLDDLTLAPNGMIYAAAWLTGEVLRVNVTNGESCAASVSVAQPSSARIASGFGKWDGKLFVTDFGGPGELFASTPAEA